MNSYKSTVNYLSLMDISPTDFELQFASDANPTTADILIFKLGFLNEDYITIMLQLRIKTNRLMI